MKGEKLAFISKILSMMVNKFFSLLHLFLSLSLFFKTLYDLYSGSLSSSPQGEVRLVLKVKGIDTVIHRPLAQAT